MSSLKYFAIVALYCICSIHQVNNSAISRYKNVPKFIKHSPMKKARYLSECVDKSNEFSIEQKGDFFVLYNFVPSTKTFTCYETITYTTQADYSFLDNLPILADRWQGPISIALYAPGEDFKGTLDSIAYLRRCYALVKDFVTFHVLIKSEHFPKSLHASLQDIYKDKEYNCSTQPPYKINTKDLYKNRMNLTYPINTARNVARIMATTHFVLASDIELYPTRNFIQKFLQMIADNPQYEYRNNPRVYALAIFEILENEKVPETKTALQTMLKAKRAFLFHWKICSFCHAVPNSTRWINEKETQGLNVFTVGKREGKYKVWEAFYVGTNYDPIFDERLTWEGQSNKMTQGYSLCLLNYDYLVLDNAFLVHKPGVKRRKVQVDKYSSLVAKTNKLIQSTIKQEIQAMYGKRDKCYIS